MVLGNFARQSWLYTWLKRIRQRYRTRQVCIQYLKQDGVRKLHVGCGGNVFAGWLNVDIEPHGPDVAFLDASKVFPFETSSFDYIYSEHMFEHLDLEGQLNMLSECLRVLKPAGMVRIATPDLESISEIVRGDDEFFRRYMKWYVYTFNAKAVEVLGDQAVSPEVFFNTYFYNWGHKFIHGRDTLRVMLERSGFSQVCIRGIKESPSEALSGLECHGNVISDEFNSFETVVVEGCKPGLG